MFKIYDILGGSGVQLGTRFNKLNQLVEQINFSVFFFMQGFFKADLGCMFDLRDSFKGKVL